MGWIRAKWAVLLALFALQVHAAEPVYFGDGTGEANPAQGDPPHWFNVTNDPKDGQGLQLFRLNCYGEKAWGCNLHFARYFGTAEAPRAIGEGAVLVSMGPRGYDGTMLAQSSGALQAIATEAFSPGHHGMKWRIEAQGNGQAGRVPVIEIQAGGITVNGSITATGAVSGSSDRWLWLAWAVNLGLLVALLFKTRSPRWLAQSKV